MNSSKGMDGNLPLHTDSPDRFQTWFDKQEEESYEFVAARLAIRCLPALSDIYGKNTEPDYATHLRSKRLTLTLCVALIDRQPKHTSILNKNATSYLDDYSDLFDRESGRFIKTRGHHAIRCISVASHIFLNSKGKDWVAWDTLSECAKACVLDTDFDSFSESWFSKQLYQEVIIDCGHCSFEEPLWSKIDVSDTNQLKEMLKQWLDIPSSNTFWNDWYNGFLVGKPLDWELQRRVALIDDTIWQAGPETVAEEIEKIRAKYDLEKRIDELEADMRRATVNRHGIGGNLPPEMIDDALIVKELVIVWYPLECLKEEIEQDDPDPNRLQKIIDALVTALNKGYTWCLKKGDLIVDTAIKWAIPAGGTGYLALNAEKLEAVIEAAKKLLSIL